MNLLECAQKYTTQVGAYWSLLNKIPHEALPIDRIVAYLSAREPEGLLLDVATYGLLCLIESRIEEAADLVKNLTL